MSINVTVSGNPISIRRGKMVLSDLENIKKSEREHRRRLRSEQVREQSRALSKRILERTRQIEQEQLSRLERDGNTETKKAHDRRLMELQRRYQDIENIGYAHENALKQPDVKEIKKIEEQRNKALAKIRGLDAIQQLQESNKVVSPHLKRQQRLLNVRNLENERSCMVAQLPKKSCIAKNHSIDSLENENVKTSSKRRVKCIVSKKSPVKKLKETKVHSNRKKTPCVSVSVCNEGTNGITSTMTTCMDESKVNKPNKLSNFPKKFSDTIEEGSNMKICESDDNEPRKTIPVTSSVSNKPENLFRYNNENYQNNTSSDLSSTCTTSSSSISDDSSYFSDNAYKVSTIRKTPLHHTSPITSKIDLYDHKTRQRNAYDRPSGLVERINMKNKPSAEDLAQEIKKLENQKSEVITSQKKSLQKRIQDAALREKIRRDYQALLKNLDLLSKEERKLKANKISNDTNQVSHPAKNSEDHTRRQKKMDRAFQTILHSFQEPVTSDNWTERPITLTPRNYIHSETIPTSVWRAPPYMDERQAEESYSEDDDDFTRKRKISELLLKIEKLKKRLLQEYGADLPDDIFNASVKSLFNNSNFANQQQINNNIAKSATSEIQVINMSSCEESIKPARKIISQNKKTSSIQASTNNLPRLSSESTVSTRDQQVQVELEQTKAKDEVVKKSLEPVVTIITPKNSNSSTSICSDSSVATDLVVGVNKQEITVLPKNRDNSIKIVKNTSSASVKSRRYSTNKTPVKISFEQKSGSTAFKVAGLLIDADKKKITILPRRRKTASKTVLLPTASGKSHSLPGSRDNSPVKKGSKSAPPSQQSSPKKSPNSDQTKVIEKQETSIEEQRYKTQYTQVSIDSSTESSQLNYASETATATGTARLFRSFQTLTSKQTISKLQDSSDASTTYASPPTATAGSMIKAISRSTPILELLNSSLNDAINQRQVSPVSSPETPSPRTMKLPSNVRRSDKISKSLKFTSLFNRQTRAGSSNFSQCNPANCTQLNDKISLQTKQTIQNHICTCKNPTCKLFHDKSEDIQSFDLRNCPEILEKFEDLKNDCTERIASLTDSIQKLRNEQGFELPVTTNKYSKPVSKIISNGQLSGSYETNRLVNSIEAIHAQLKEKLMESRKIISGEGIKLSKSPMPYNHVEKSPTISINLSKNTSATESFEEDIRKAKGMVIPASGACSKPKIINNERVNIKLDRFRLGQTSRSITGAGESSKTVGTTMTTVMTEATARTASNAPDQNEDMIEMLSKEILEQSKNINKSIAIDSLKDSDDSILKSSQVALKDFGESGKNASSNNEQNQSVNLDTSISDFVPLLAGIPKIPRTLTKNSTNGRGRPPVTLISGPYRTEIVSPAHELSTIVEFDTPDTANKSQVSNRSPSNNCRKKMSTKEVAQLTTLSPSKTTDIKLTKCKPSVHVAPLPMHRSPQRSLNLSNRSTSKNTDKSPRKFAEKSVESPKNRKGLKNEAKESNSSDSLHTLPDVHIDHLHHSQDNADGNNEFRISEISELHSLPEENIDRLLISDLHEESKSKSVMIAHKQELDKGRVTSSDSTSFSGLSGVSEITSTPTSDLNLFKYPSSPEEMELALKKWGLGWAIPTLKKTREASALGSSSSSDVTPVNTAARLVSPVKKQQDTTAHDLPMISDVSSISIKHANKSTEKSVLVKGRTSTPNRLSNSNSDDTISTLDSFSSDLNIVVQNQSADITIPNISFSNDKLA